MHAICDTNWTCQGLCYKTPGLPWKHQLSAGPVRYILKWHLQWHRGIAKIHMISDTNWTWQGLCYKTPGLSKQFQLSSQKFPLDS